MRRLLGTVAEHVRHVGESVVVDVNDDDRSVRIRRRDLVLLSYARAAVRHQVSHPSLLRSSCCLLLLVAPLGGCDPLRSGSAGEPIASATVEPRTAPDAVPSGDQQDTELYARLRRDRVILLGTVIDDDAATQVIAELLYLQSDDRSRRITILINSPGGQVTSALAIQDTMLEMEPPVATVVLSEASGVAAAIAAAGDRGHRTALRQAIYSLAPTEGGDGQAAEDRERLGAVVATRLAAHTGRDVAEVSEAMRSRKRFTSEAALGWGLVDTLVDRPPTPP